MVPVQTGIVVVNPQDLTRRGGILQSRAQRGPNARVNAVNQKLRALQLDPCQLQR